MRLETFRTATTEFRVRANVFTRPLADVWAGAEDYCDVEVATETAKRKLQAHLTYWGFGRWSLVRNITVVK